MFPNISARDRSRHCVDYTSILYPMTAVAPSGALDLHSRRDSVLQKAETPLQSCIGSTDA